MELRSFAKDAAIYALGNIGLRLAALLLTPIYTYSLSVSDYGVWATLVVTVQLLLILMSMGMRETSMRFTKEHENAHTVGVLLGTTTLLVVAGGAVVSVAVCLFLPGAFRAILHRQDVHELLALTCLAALSQALSIQVMSYYRASNRPARYMSAGLAGAGLLLVTTTVAVPVLKLGITGALWSYIFTYAAVAAAVALDIMPSTGVAFSPSLVAPLLGFGAPLVVSACGQFALGSASVYLLGYFAGLEAVAVYSLALRFSLLMSVGISLPFQLAFQPFVYGNLDRPEVKNQAARLLTYLLLATSMSAFGLIVLSYVLLPLVAPPAYSNAFMVMLLLLPGQAFLGVHYFGETLIGAVRKTPVLGLVNSACAALCVGLNVLLIPPLGWLGAVLATNVAGLMSDGTVLSMGLRAFGLGRAVEWHRLALIAVMLVAELTLAFALRDAGPVVFLGGMALFMLVGVGLLVPFLSPREKAAMRGLAGRLGARIAPRAYVP
jgi:O-antigen/teichoic acid export membrane protein